MFIVHRIVFALNGIALLLLLLSYAAPYISPALFWPIAFLGLAYPVLLIINILFSIYWILFFKIKFLMSLMVIAIGYSYIPKYVQLNAKKLSEKDGTLEVVSFNMKYFGAYEGKKPEDADHFLEVLDKVGPDILCLQECENFNTKAEGAAFKKLYKKIANFYTYNLGQKDGYKSADGLMIASRFPIIDSGIVERDERSDNYTIFVDIKVGEKTYRIINTHLQSIRFEEKEYNAVKKLDFENDTVVSGYKSITHKLKTAFLKRAKQAETIQLFIEQSPYPVIVCGDFNDSPTSYAYHHVRGNLKDAFIEAASGLGRTYTGSAPSFRIDYVLFDASLDAFNYYAKPFEFSDHKMVSCTLKAK